MLKKKRTIIYENFLAGINASLPILVLLFFLGWAMKIIFKLIQPMVIFMAPREVDQTIAVKIIALGLVLFIVTFIGAMLRKPKNKRLFSRFENRIFKILPGYTMVKEIILQFLGTKRAPFSRVAIVRTFSNSTRQIGFVTDDHEDGSYTVFVPTGPNPTSGNIFILYKDQVKIIDMPVELAMKTIISCGIGSAIVNDKNKNN